jgi:hypothetical protein
LNKILVEPKQRKRLLTVAVLSAVILVVIGIIVLVGPISGSILPSSKPSPTDFVHPLFSIPAVLFVISAYLFKRRGKERFLAHYLAGTAGVSLTIVAFLIALNAVSLYPRQDLANHFLFTINFHVIVAFLAVIMVLVQGYTGLSMVLFGRTKDRIFNHKFLSKWVLIIYLIQGALGLSILISLILQYYI